MNALIIVLVLPSTAGQDFGELSRVAVPVLVLDRFSFARRKSGGLAYHP